MRPLDDIHFEIVEPESLRYTFRARPAQFGTGFPRLLKNVGLVIVEPLDGCSDPWVNKVEIPANVALVERGRCSFLQKCINAAATGALGVIIFDSDHDNDDSYVDMIDDSTRRNCSIPALFLLGKDGYMITRALNALDLHRAMINIPVNISHIPLHKQKHPPWMVW